MEISSVHKWQGTQTGRKVICLHGFLGTGADFEILADHYVDHPILIAPNFPDFTCAPSKQPWNWKDCLDTLDAFIQEEANDDDVILLGYSMGGRIALQYALEYPQRLSKLVLVGATPGLPDPMERQERATADTALANALIQQSLQSFLDNWNKQDLIQSQQCIPEPYRSTMQEQRLAHNKSALAESLIGLGTGTMASGWDHLTDLLIPTLITTGEQDTKFERIAKGMIELLPKSEHQSIAQAGHAACFEQPRIFSERLHLFLAQNSGG